MNQKIHHNRACSHKNTNHDTQNDRVDWDHSLVLTAYNRGSVTADLDVVGKRRQAICQLRSSEPVHRMIQNNLGRERDLHVLGGNQGVRNNLVPSHLDVATIPLSIGMENRQLSSRIATRVVTGVSSSRRTRERSRRSVRRELDGLRIVEGQSNLFSVIIELLFNFIRNSFCYTYGNKVGSLQPKIAR